MEENNNQSTQPVTPSPEPQATPVVPATEMPAAPAQPAMSAQAAPAQPTQPVAGAPVMPAQPKQPMDPAKKKKIILISSICGGVGVLAIVAAIVIPILLKVDYGESYRVAKETSEALSNFYSDSACSNANYYLNSSYTSDTTYDGYLTQCVESFQSNPSELVNKLSATSAVKRDSEIKKQFDAFYAEFQKDAVADGATLNKKIDLYRAWHKFVIAKYNLKTGALDAEIATAAAPLMNSGDESLKAYAEGWIPKRTAYAHAYTTWYNSPGYYNDEYDKKQEAEDALENYETENEPDFVKVAKNNSSNSSSAYTEFSKLFELIADAYERNYNYGSNDCLEVLGQVYCNL